MGSLGPMEFAVLGPLDVRAGTEAISIRRGLPRTLLIALLLRPGQTVSSDQLVDLLWTGEDLPRNPSNALQIQVSYLRKSLGAGVLAGSYLVRMAADSSADCPGSGGRARSGGSRNSGRSPDPGRWPSC